MPLINMALLPLFGSVGRAIEPMPAEYQAVSQRFDEWLAGPRLAQPPRTPLP
jgi:hypothetical protein